MNDRWFNLYADGSVGMPWDSRTDAIAASKGHQHPVARIRVRIKKA